MYTVNIDRKKNYYNRLKNERAKMEQVLSWTVILQTHKTTAKDTKHQGFLLSRVCQINYNLRSAI